MNKNNEKEKKRQEASKRKKENKKGFQVKVNRKKTKCPEKTRSKIREKRERDPVFFRTLS